jgi:hypothetical protein
VAFEWGRAPGAAASGKIQLQLSRDASFDKPLRSIDANGDAPFVVPLAEGSYFWRVVAAGGADLSETRSLRVIRPGTVRLEWPEAQARIEYFRQAPAGRFRWRTLGQQAGGIDRIEVASDSSFTTPLKPTSLERSTGEGGLDPRGEARFGALPPGRYYWRVVSRYEDTGPDASQVAEISSEVREVTVAQLDRLPSPRLVEPASGATVTLTTSRPKFRLEWAPVGEASGYRVRVATDPDFKQVVLTESSLKPEWEGELQASGTLYWSVQATVGRPSDPVSGEDSTPARPQAFALSRADGFRLIAPNDKEPFRYYSSSDKPEITFSWEPRGGADEYEVQVAADDRFREVLFTDKVDEPRLATRKAPVGSLYWRVRALGGDGKPISVSQLGRYRLTEAPTLASPEKTLPEAAAQLKADPAPKVKFEWKPVPEAKGYVVLMWRQDEAGRMKPLWSAEAGESGLEREVGPGNYQWTVRSVDPAGRRGVAGSPRALVVRSPDLLAAPDKLDPPTGTRIESPDPKSIPIKWEPKPGAKGYSVKISRLKPDGSRETVRELQVDKNEVSLPDSLPSGEYEWQVQAVGVAQGAPAGSKPRPGEPASSQFSVKWIDVLSAPSKVKVKLEEDAEPARAPAASGGRR